MSERELDFLNKIQGWIVKSLITFAGIVIIQAVVFYFKVNAKNNEQDSRLFSVENKCADKNLIDIKLNYISNSIEEIKQDLKTRRIR